MAWQGTAHQLVDLLRELRTSGRPTGWLRQSAEYDSYAALFHLHEILNNAVQPALDSHLATWPPPLPPAPIHPQPGSIGPDGIVGLHQFPEHDAQFIYPSFGVADLAWTLAEELDQLRIDNNWDGPRWLSQNMPLDEVFAQDVLSFIRDAADCD